MLNIFCHGMPSNKTSKVFNINYPYIRVRSFSCTTFVVVACKKKKTVIFVDRVYLLIHLYFSCTRKLRRN